MGGDFKHELSERDTTSSSVSSGPSTVEITRRSDRSTRTRLLHASFKPLRPRLVKPTQPKPGLSPELQTPDVVFENCNVRQRNVAEIRVYDINKRSHQTSEHFIPAQVQELKNELTPVKTNETPTHNHALELIQSHEASDIVARDFALPQNAKRPRHKQVYYFAGGGFQSPPAEQHWRFCADLAYRMTKEYDQPTTVSLVSYPLAPRNRIGSAFDALEKWYDWVLPSSPPPSPNVKPASPGRSPLGNGHSPLGNGHSPSGGSPTGSTRNGSNGSLALTRTQTKTLVLPPDDEIIFAGDSAGGNVALSLTLHMLSKDPHRRAPDQLLLISPVVDLTNENPDQLDIAKRDPLLTMEYVREVARTWCGSEAKHDDPRASPLHADLSDLAFRGVRVHGIVAGDDLLSPDAMRLIEKCRRTGVQGKWLVWEKMMHAFPLAPNYGLPESKAAMEWIMSEVLDSGVSSASGKSMS